MAASHYLDKHVTYQIYVLRKILGQFRRRIITVKKSGYKYENDVRVNLRGQIDVQQIAKVARRLK